MSEKSLSLDAVKALVAQFAVHEPDYMADAYNETQARSDFITPLLAALGWDVRNLKTQPPSLREVVEEANVIIDDASPSRKPDYELRLARIRKLFVEAKKPSVNILTDRDAAFQARRYGYSASMPIVILTNFRHIVVYDCSVPPKFTDDPHVARVASFAYTEFESRFDALWEYCSREVIYSGRFDGRYKTELSYRGSAPFDELFLKQVREWRHHLAVDILGNVPSMSAVELTYAVQIFLSRLIFLRICEDRELENYEQLQTVAASGGFAPYKELLQQADTFYNSGLFDVMADERLGTIVSNTALNRIISELYYPQSPYTFSVVEAEVLGRIYEQFLGEVITVTDGHVSVVERPEVRESGGVVPTPRQIVDEIIDRTVYPLINGRSPVELKNFTVLDMCCGSGVFLLSAFERLCDHYLTWYVADGVDTHRGTTIIEVSTDSWRLTYGERRRILLAHIRGVDINAEAVEVAQLSLLLKLIEGENRADLADFVHASGEQALPRLSDIVRSGNSLVSRPEWNAVRGHMTADIEAIVCPFDWKTEFPLEVQGGGFSAIVGNPPYIRIQNMAKYSPAEVAYYQADGSPFAVAHQDNFDKYALFIERGLEFLAAEGRQGFITPHKFMTITSGRPVRLVLADRVSEVVHFGSQSVFPNVSNYTAIVVCGPPSPSPVMVEQVRSIDSWHLGVHEPLVEFDRSEFTAEPWHFASSEFNALIAKHRVQGCRYLEEVADVFVGVQTSSDQVYIVTQQSSTDTHVSINWDGREWHLERAMLRPCLNDIRIESFAQPVANQWMIFPYVLDADGKAHLVQPDVLSADFPGCWEYLNARKDELATRSITGGIAAERQWYQYGRAQSLSNFGRSKIILPVLSLEPRYAQDDDDIVVTGGGNGPYYLIRSDDEHELPNSVLLAILNHPLAEAVVRSHTSVFGGGYYSHGKQFISDILVPILSTKMRDAIADMVAEVIDARLTLANAKTPAEIDKASRRYHGLRDRLTDLVFDAFSMDDAEKQVVISVPMP